MPFLDEAEQRTPQQNFGDFALVNAVLARQFVHEFIEPDDVADFQTVSLPTTANSRSLFPFPRELLGLVVELFHDLLNLYVRVVIKVAPVLENHLLLFMRITIHVVTPSVH